MTYQDKLEERRDRLEARAEKLEAEAASRHKNADRIAYVTNGQPILVGHHSEKRHRRDIDRMVNDTRRGIAAAREAGELRARAAAVGTHGISSEDEEAAAKITRKIAKLEKDRDDRKALNAWFKKHGTAVGFTPPSTGVPFKAETAARIDAQMTAQNEPGANWVPDKHKITPGYVFTYMGAEIRRLKGRLLGLEDEIGRRAAGPADDDAREGFTYSEDLSENRACVYFDARPSREACTIMRRNGWKFSRRFTRWQRLLNANARSSWQFYVAPELETLATGGGLI